MHKGVEGTLKRLKQVTEWEGMKEDVRTWVSNCIQCAMNKARPPYQAS